MSDSASVRIGDCNYLLQSLGLEPPRREGIGIFDALEDVFTDLERRLTNKDDRLRSMPYDEFLKSPEWRETRRLALQRVGHRCQKCGATKRLQVHHLTYLRRGAEDLDDLEVLCRGCHEAEHGIEPTMT